MVPAQIQKVKQNLTIGGLFPNHLDSGFHFIVDDLFEAVGMRLGFHFIGVEGEVSVGNNIVNAVWYCKILIHTANE